MPTLPDELPDAIRAGRIDYVINNRDPGAACETGDGVHVRRMATENNVTMFTSLDAVRVLLDGLGETVMTVPTIDA